MAQIISGDREVLSHMLFGGPDPYLQQYVNNVNNSFISSFTDLGRQFISTAQNVFARMETSEASRLAKAALRKMNVFFQEDIIFAPTEISQLQEAPNTMVRWIMAHPTLRQHYFDNTIDAYGDRYQPEEPMRVFGWEHADYCRIYSGWLESKEETDEEGNTVYYDELVQVMTDEDEPELISDDEALYIQQAHMLVDVALAEGRDPTSYYDNTLV